MFFTISRVLAGSQLIFISIVWQNHTIASAANSRQIEAYSRCAVLEPIDAAPILAPQLSRERTGLAAIRPNSTAIYWIVPRTICRQLRNWNSGRFSVAAIK